MTVMISQRIFARARFEFPQQLALKNTPETLLSFSNCCELVLLCYYHHQTCSASEGALTDPEPRQSVFFAFASRASGLTDGPTLVDLGVSNRSQGGSLRIRELC